MQGRMARALGGGAFVGGPSPLSAQTGGTVRPVRLATPAQSRANRGQQQQQLLLQHHHHHHHRHQIPSRRARVSATRPRHPRPHMAAAPPPPPLGPRQPPAPPGGSADHHPGHQQQQQKKEKETLAQTPSSPLTPLRSGARELVAALVRAGQAGAVLVVVYYRARWCRSCATLAPKVDRVAADATAQLLLLHRRRPEPTGIMHAKTSPPPPPPPPIIDWYSADIVEEPNRALTAAMDVRMLPTFHFYKPIPAGTAPPPPPPHTATFAANCPPAAADAASASGTQNRQSAAATAAIDASTTTRTTEAAGKDRENDDASEEDAHYIVVLREYLERSFIAGPFGARRLQDNLKDLFDTQE